MMSTVAIKIKVTIAQPFVVAGMPFSLTTTVENAHEEEVEILEYFYHIPYQVQWIHDAKYDTAYEEQRRAPWYRRIFMSSIWRKAAQPPGQVMRYANIEDSDQPVETVLPSETSSYSFKALVSRWLFASGGEIVFPGSIKYRFKEKIHFAPFEVCFVLRPPLIANGLGAALGAILGSSARGLRDSGAEFFQHPSLEFLAATSLAAILAIVAVIYSSRRTGESQPIITVEDFWGGLIAGFSVGYLGHEFFQRLVPVAGNGTIS